MTAPTTLPRKVLVVSDSVAATQHISFGQAFAEDEAPAFVLEADPGSETEIAARFAEISPECLILSRQTLASGLIWVRLARAAGIPVVFHVDDDLLAVPRSLGREKYERYNRPDALRALRENIESCDLVYASTGPLAETLRGHGIATPIVAGDVYCSVDAAQVGATVPLASGPVIGYMGTSGHGADLDEIVPALEQTMLAFPQLQFECFGGLEIPGPLQRFDGRVRRIAGVAGYADFLAKMRTLGWWIGLAPLQDTTFNRCKADTKWVEYSSAGMAVVAADLPVYHRACGDGTGILASGTAEWARALDHLLTDPGRRLAMAAAARNKLRSQYSHAMLRRQVQTILGRVAVPA